MLPRSVQRLVFQGMLGIFFTWGAPQPLSAQAFSGTSALFGLKYEDCQTQASSSQWLVKAASGRAALPCWLAASSALVYYEP